MRSHSYGRSFRLLTFLLVIVISLAACNLSSPDDADVESVTVPTTQDTTPLPTSTPNLQNQAPTPLPIPSGLPYSSPTPRSISILPTQPSLATSLPVSIFILSPVPGNVVSGNVQIIGSATHPRFLQYQLEYGPDPNPGNLWFPITGALQNQVSNNLLGVWNTLSGAVPDGLYMLRLRVFQRDGSDAGTVIVNNIRVQNTAPTPQPTSTPVVQRPIAAFSQNVSSGTAPLNVQFVNQSIGQNLTYQWNFGDGTTGAEVSPLHTFTSPGTYNVVLTATNAGGSSNVSRTITVQSIDPPVAAFNVDTSSGTAPLTVRFTDRSSGGQISRWEWNFGDGGTSTQQNPSHTFNEGGDFNVILTVRGPGGSSFATRQINVEFPQVDPPVASFTPNQTVTGTAPLTVDFQNTTSGGQVDTYRWDFGDGSLVSTEASPSHTFNTAGTSTVTLTATGPGGSSTATVQVVVEAPLAVDFEFAASNLDVQFASIASGGTGSYSYAWDFGDGQTSADPNPVVTYGAAGTYTVTLTVSDGADQASASKQVTVQEPPPELAADFTFTVDGLTAQMASQVSGGTGNYAYVWDFGDGQTSTTANPAVTYSAGGTYNVTLVVNDGMNEVTVSHPVTVEEPLPDLTADFNFTVDNLTVQFAAAPGGGTGSYSYAWDFGDGQTSADPNPVVTYGAGGVYTVTLTVDDGVSQAQISKQVPVEAPLPELTADFSFTTDGLTAQFTSTVSGGTGSYSYAWDFGDGQTSADPNPVVTYGAAGTYTVTLTVDDGVSQVPVSKQVTVEAALAADFSFTTDGLTAQFTSTVSGGTGSYTYAWDFGDGQTSADPNPVVTYGAAGTYTVTLVVNDGVNQATVTYPVTLEAPQPGLTADFNYTVDGLTVQFAAAPGGGTGSYSYAWDFGDGQTSTEANPLITYDSGGTYDVTLTVNDGVNQAPVTKQVTVEAALTTIASDTPVLPDLAPLEAPVRDVFQAGVTEGRNPVAFIVIGDETSESGVFLDPFATPGQDYTAPEADFLDPLISAYNTADLGLGAGINSFNRDSVATGALTAEELNTETQACPGVGNVTRIECEISTVNPTIAIISVGYNDIVSNTDPATFKTNLEGIVQSVLDSNVVPLVMTVYPVPGSEQQSYAINDAIIEVAEAKQVPLLNIWRAFDELPDNGLDAGGDPTVDPNGEDYVSPSTTAGANLRNSYLLTLLNQIGQTVQ